MYHFCKKKAVNGLIKKDLSVYFAAVIHEKVKESHIANLNQNWFLKIIRDFIKWIRGGEILEKSDYIGIASIKWFFL